jgi:hypothetical protein
MSAIYDSNMEMYWLDKEEFETLKAIERQLYGDGSALSADVRRDMANTMNYILGAYKHSS